LIAFIVGSGHKVLCKVPINILSMYMCYVSVLLCLLLAFLHHVWPPVFLVGIIITSFRC
jgi:hypothetical protein